MPIAESVAGLLDGLALGVRELLLSERISEPYFVGIQTGGAWVAEALCQTLALAPPGRLNIAFYRDDFSRIGLHPRVLPSTLTESVDNRHVVLVDDVLYTGRTVRAAMNALFDYGRPARISLAVLIDRDGRELPVQADVIGKTMQVGRDHQIRLSGPDPLSLSVIKVRT